MSYKFERSRKNLSIALKNLEDAIKDKVHEASVVVSENKADVKIAEQNSLIIKLKEEVNRLQNELSELGKEAEFLKESNRTLWQRVENFNQQKTTLVNAMESDLSIIREVIKKYDS